MFEKLWFCWSVTDNPKFVSVHLIPFLSVKLASLLNLFLSLYFTLDFFLCHLLFCVCLICPSLTVLCGSFFFFLSYATLSLSSLPHHSSNWVSSQKVHVSTHIHTHPLEPTPSPLASSWQSSDCPVKQYDINTKDIITCPNIKPAGITEVYMVQCACIPDRTFCSLLCLRVMTTV